jgi:hypothetical protein
MRAQQAAGQQPAAGGAAQADPFKITADNAIMIFQVDPAKTADWESAWMAIKDKLSKLTDHPDHKALAESINMFKVSTPSADPSQPALYVLHLSPPAKISYAPNQFLYNPPGVIDRKEADEIYAKIAGAFKGLNVLPLTKVGG